jgi:hypothetical protein
VAGTAVERLRRDGRIDSHWRTQLGRMTGLGPLIRVGDRLYVTNGLRVFGLEVRTGRRLWASPVVSHGSHGARAAIETLAGNRRTVFLGGIFGQVGPAQRTAVAALDANSGKLLPWRVRLGNRTEGVGVAALAVSGQRLYLGGGFATVGKAQRNSGVASVDIHTGKVTAFAPRVSPSPDDVTTIGVFRHTVFVGGTFGGGAFDARTSTSLRRFHAIVGATTISVHGSTVYFGGDLRSPISENNIAAMDARTAKERRWAPVLAKYVSVGEIAVSGDEVFVGGQFCSTLG